MTNLFQAAGLQSGAPRPLADKLTALIDQAKSVLPSLATGSLNWQRLAASIPALEEHRCRHIDGDPAAQAIALAEAGASPEAQALLGKTVAMLGGAMYTQYRCLSVSQCMLLPV